MFLRSHAKRLRKYRENFMDDEMRERRHKKSQARLSRQLLKAAEKLGVSPSSTEEKSAEKDTVETALSEGVALEKVTSEDIVPVKLTDVVVHTNEICKNKGIIGTLEAHLNEFQFSTSSSHIQIKFLHKNVKHAFIHLNTDGMPFLHYHLYDDIKVGTEKTKDIQFHGTQTLAERKNPASDSGNIEKENQNRDMGIINVFEEFIYRVDFHIWDNIMPIILPIGPLKPRYEFEGYLHGKGLVNLALTPYCLIELLKAPFLVVSLREVEIIHLAVGVNHVDMTVVYKDFKRGVLQIQSIPITRLNGIREWMGIADVKYYLSTQSPKWGSLLEGITKDPQSFINAGGWDILDPLAGFDPDSDAHDNDFVYVDYLEGEDEYI